METSKREFAFNGKRSLPEFLKSKGNEEEERQVTINRDNSGKVVKAEIKTIKK